MKEFTQDIIFWRDEDGRPQTNIHIRKERIHSPDGINFGYSGSGPAEFAYQILLYFLDKEQAYCFHQDFKTFFISGAPEEGGTIKNSDIVKWIEDKQKMEE